MAKRQELIQKDLATVGSRLSPLTLFASQSLIKGEFSNLQWSISCQLAGEMINVIMRER